ncbi:hypothetical protein RJT34_11302 [Clitoria ternatea]|uniref:Uncharacterized protein n=1 Tax=Clitoria ternatea TaxID=43366 RepID=A0AAN9JKA9_CLITE
MEPHPTLFRKPLSDRTNTSSSSSSFVSLKPHKPNPFSSSSSLALDKSPTECTPATTNVDYNAPNPSSTTPKTSSPHASDDFASGTVDTEASELISIVDSRRRSSNRRKKDKGKHVAVPVSSAPVLKISSNREKIDGLKGENQCKAKAMAIPRRKAGAGHVYSAEASEMEDYARELISENPYPQQLTMEPNPTQILTRRKPLSDLTNTSSSSVPPKPHKSNPSSALNKSPSKCISATANLDNNALNPSSPLRPILSMPSPKGIVDVEGSEPISIVYGQRRSLNKRKKDKGKGVADLMSSAPVLKISSNREKNDGVEGENQGKAKAMTVPCRKKQRAVSVEDAFKDPSLQDFIEKQKAYFKMIDEFELAEEEVESIHELD